MELKKPNQTKVQSVNMNLKKSERKLKSAASVLDNRSSLPEEHMNPRERGKWRRLTKASKQRIIHQAQKDSGVRADHPLGADKTLQNNDRRPQSNAQQPVLNTSQRKQRANQKNVPNFGTEQGGQGFSDTGQTRKNEHTKKAGATGAYAKNAANKAKNTAKNSAKKAAKDTTKAVGETVKKAVVTTVKTGVDAATTAATGGTDLPVKIAKKAVQKFKETLKKVQKQTQNQISQMQQDARGRASANEMKSVSDVFKYVKDMAMAVVLAPVLMVGAALVFAMAAIIIALMVPIILITVLISTLAALLALIISIIFDINAQNGGQAIARVAQEELEQSAFNVGGYKYKDWYGMDDNWCNMFVSWCANECGFLESGILPKTAAVSSSMEFYKARDQFRTRESGYKPKAGDIIISKSAGASHIGIVVEYEDKSDTITTIEGNTGSSSASPYHRGSKVAKKKYHSDNARITGYGTPAYPADMSLDGSVMGVIRNIFYAIETGGQEYGNARYDDVTAAYANTGNETAITIGAGGWFATEARRLLDLIRQTKSERFAALDTAGISDDLDSESWQHYNIDPKSAKGFCIAAIISSPEGIACQNQLMDEQINEYLGAAKEAGIEDLGAQVLYAETMHLGGKSAADRILRLTDKPYTAENYYAAVTHGGSGSQVNAPMFQSRHACVYRWIKQYLVPAQE